MKQTFTVKLGDKRYVGHYLWANNTRLLFQPARKYGLHEKDVSDRSPASI